MTKRSITKDFYRLQKNIASFSNDEAKIIEFDDELHSFKIELNIKDGYYKDGIFVFEVSLLDEYPASPPLVTFQSQIFHPNIGDGYDEPGEVCLNLLDGDWQETNDFEDVVQGMLYLVKNPAWDDPLNPLFSYDDGENTDQLSTNFLEDFAKFEKEFIQSVRKSLEGGEVEGVQFERNPGLVKKDTMLEDQKNLPAKIVETDFPTNTDQKMSGNTMSQDISTLSCDTAQIEVNSTVTNIYPKFTLSTDSYHDPSFCRLYEINVDFTFNDALYWVLKNFVSISTNAKTIHSIEGCPKWLVNLAVFMFGGDARRCKKNKLDISSRNLLRLQRLPRLRRAIMWNR